MVLDLGADFWNTSDQFRPVGAHRCPRGSRIACDAANHRRADGAGRVRVTLDVLGKQTSLGCDANGNRVSTRDPNNVGMDCVYDAANRETQCTATRTDVATVTTSQYDAHHNRTHHTDSTGR